MLLRGLFFPRQEVQAVPGFDPKGSLNGTVVDVGFDFDSSNATEGVYHASLTISVNTDQSKNYPYTFTVESFASIVADKNESEDFKKLQFTVYSILAGAARERIADLTARGPYSTFLLSPVGIPTFSDLPSQSTSND